MGTDPRAALRLLVATAIAIGVGYVVGLVQVGETAAEAAASPVKAQEDHDVYYPSGRTAVDSLTPCA